MPDVTIEGGLRSAFQAESDHLGLTITTAELERRLVVRRRSRSGRRIQLLAAAIAIVVFAGIAALSNGWLRAPAIGGTVTPAPSATSSPTSSGLQPIPATPGRIEVTRIDPTAPTDPVDRTFEGTVHGAYLGDGTVDFFVDERQQHVDCSSDGESSVGGILQANETLQSDDRVLGYRLVTTGDVSFGVLVDLQVVSEPPPSEPVGSPAAFTPPEMLVSISTLGRAGEAMLLSTPCYSFELADGQTGTIRCAGVPSEVVCCEKLDVPWGSDLTFTIPDGWAIERSEIGSKGNLWADDRPAPGRTITGWSSLGEEVISLEGTYSKDGDRFTATFAVPIHGPTVEPSVPAPTTACGTPDLTSKTPPMVELVQAGAPAVAGEFGTTGWGDTFSESAGDPMPEEAIEVAAGAELELRIAGAVCARAWEIGYGPRGTGEWLSIDQVGSLVSHHRMRPTDQAALANRFDLAELPAGDWYIEAVLHYADGDAWMGWHVIVR
jgi:hypothetical protein